MPFELILIFKFLTEIIKSIQAPMANTVGGLTLLWRLQQPRCTC